MVPLFGMLAVEDDSCHESEVFWTLALIIVTCGPVQRNVLDQGRFLADVQSGERGVLESNSGTLGIPINH